MKNHYIAVALFFGSQTFSIPGVSAEVSLSDVESDPVIVTATRTAQTADETLASVTVITREDIERQHAFSLMQVLQSVAGISMARNGGAGTLSSLFLRGTNSNHLVVLIDGIKVGSAISGQAAFEFIPVEQIERIEIVRGPRSSLYGSEAIGGVIQIFTRKGDGQLRPSLSLTAASYDSYKSVAAVSGGNGTTNYNISIGSFDSKGFSACDQSGGCAIEPDDDGFRYVTGSGSVSHQLNNRTGLDATWMRTRGDVRYDGFFNHSKSIQQTEGIKLSHEFSADWFLAFQVGQSTDKRDDFNNSTFMGFANTKRNNASLQNDFLLGNGAELTVGLDYMDDQLKSDTAYDRTSRINQGFFYQYLHQIKNQNYQISTRYDDNEQFGSHATGNVAWGYDINKQQRVTLSYGSAFAAPTFSDLYYPCCGNPDLVPEKSKSLEIGYRHRQGWGSWALNFYQTKIEDLIVWNPALLLPVNVDNVTIHGVELLVKARIMNWDTQLDISLLDPENKSGVNKGKTLERRAKKLARLVVAQSKGEFDYGATLVFNGKRYNNAENTVALHSYYTLDLNGGYQANKDWRVGASVKNLFDEDYELVRYYNTAGRNYLVTVSYQPDQF